MNYSIAKFVGYDGAKYKYGWRQTTAPLETQIVNSCWSPIVWYTGVRHSKHFAFAELNALDFDGSWNIEECIDYVRFIGAWCLIGTTKSHRVDKHCFRLVLRWAKRLDDLKQFEQNQSRFVDALPADPSCRDGARFYFPCREIVYSQGGRPIHVLPYKPTPSRKPSKKPIEGAYGVPRWMRDELQQGIPEGQRNRTAFRFALHLKNCGFSEDDARDVLNTITIPESELTKTVSSAWRYSLPERG